MEKRKVGFSAGDTAVAALLFLPAGRGPFPAVVVCHGAFESKESHFPLCEGLAREGIAALAPDLEGHGASGGPRSHVEMRRWVRDLAAALFFLESLGEVDGGRIGAFGFSSGGTAVLEAAAAGYGFAALVTLAATVRRLRGPEGLLLGLLNALGRASLALRGRELRLPLAAAMGRARFASDPEANRACLAAPGLREAMAALPFPGSADCYFVDTLDRVGGIRAPTLVVHGAEDGIDPPETARLLFDRLACEKELLILEASGHAAHLDREREALGRAAVDWFGRHLRRDPGASDPA